MENYVIYKRLSRESKSGANLGLDAQQSAIDNFLKTQTDYKVLKVFQEIETGTNKRHRPQLHAALELCKQEGAKLVIAKLDRLARNAHFITGLMESRVNFLALDLKEASPMTIGILACVAEAEAKSISQRTTAALQELKRNGKKLGQAGRDNLELPQTIERLMVLRHTTKAKAVSFAKKVYPSIAYFKHQGLNNFRVAQELNKLNQVSPSGRVGGWTRASVEKCIKRAV